jgi:heme exporter protein B
MRAADRGLVGHRGATIARARAALVPPPMRATQPAARVTETIPTPPRTPRPPNVARQAWLIAQKDLRIERRTREIVVTGGFFGALVAILASVAFYAGPAGAHYLAPGAIWIATAFAAVLSLGRTWQREREDGALEALLSGAVSRVAIFFGKAFGVLAFLTVIEAIVVPIVALMLHVDLASDGGGIALLLALATIGVSASGTLFGAMTARTRARELILAAVLFPLLTPTLVVGVAATRELVDGSSIADLADYLKLLIVFDIVFVAGGAALFGAVIDE